MISFVFRFMFYVSRLIGRSDSLYFLSCCSNLVTELICFNLMSYLSIRPSFYPHI